MLILCYSSLLGFFISGRVINEKEEPLSNVLITSDTKTVFSDEKGNFQTEQETGEIKFHKMGFEDVVYKFNSEIPKLIVMSVFPIKIEGTKTTGEKVEPASLAVSEKDVIVFEQNDFSEVKQLLDKTAAVHIKGNVLPGENSSISILGNLSKHTLIMLDGIPLNADGREFDITSIPSEIVSKIEIVKSASGVNAGSGNIGGVINIVTHAESWKKNKSQEFSISQTSGSFGLNSTTFTGSFTKPYNNLSASLSYLHAKNNFEYKYNLTNAPEIRKRENNTKSFMNFNLSGNNVFEHGTGKMDIIYRNFHKGLPGPINELSKNDAAFIKGSNGKIIVSFNRKTDDYSIKNKIYQFADKSVYDNTGSSTAPAEFKDETKYFKTGFMIDVDREFNDFIEAGLGSEFTRQHYENRYNESVILADTNNYAFFTDVNLTGVEFPFTMQQNIGARLDVRDSDEETSAYRSGFVNASMEYENAITTKFGGGVSSAFSLPSFYDLFWKGDSQAVGNPDLEAETAINKNMFLKIHNEFAELKTSYNMQSINNLIYWYKSASYWTAGNIADAEINNFEMNFKIKPNGFWLSGEASYLITDATDKTKLDSGEPTNTYNRPLTYVPNHKISIVETIEFLNTKVSVSYIITGKQYTSRFNDNMIIDEYGLVNADVSYLYKYKKVSINFYANFNNIFDEEYEQYLLVPRPGFNWQAGFKVNL